MERVCIVKVRKCNRVSINKVAKDLDITEGDYVSINRCENGILLQKVPAGE